MHRRSLAVASLAIAVSLGLSGCFNGFDAMTSTQGEGGDPTNINVGDVQVRGMIWVRDPANPQNASLSASFVGLRGGAPDELERVETIPAGVVSLPSTPVAVLPGESTRIGFNSDSKVTLQNAFIPESDFVDTTLVFKNAGVVQASVLIVPATGQYAGVFGTTASPSVAVSPGGGTVVVEEEVIEVAPVPATTTAAPTTVTPTPATP